MVKKRLIILLCVVLFSITALCLSCFVTLAKGEKFNESPVYKLAAYDNNIALYKNDDIITVYDEIVLNSLPPYDREAFKKGIIIEDISKLDQILQDYE